MSYRFTIAAAAALLLCTLAQKSVIAAYLTIPQTTYLTTKAHLNGTQKWNYSTAPTAPYIGSRSVDSPPVTSPYLNSAQASSNAHAGFDNRSNNLLNLRYSTYTYAYGSSPNGYAQSWTSTNGPNAGFTGMPVKISPVSGYGEYNGQRVLVTLSANYQGVGNAGSSGGYNLVNVQYAAAATNNAWAPLINQVKDTYLNNQNKPFQSRFYSTMGSTFLLAPFLQSYAPTGRAQGWLDLTVQVQRVSSTGLLSAYTVPEPTSMIGLILTAAPSLAFLRRRRLA